MFSPFLDLKAMSEEELLGKITTLRTRMQYAQNFVGDRTMINSLGMYLEAFQNEFQERQIIRANEQWTSQFPEVIESEPDFKVAAAKKAGEAAGPARPATGPATRRSACPAGRAGGATARAVVGAAAARGGDDDGNAEAEDRPGGSE